MKFSDNWLDRVSAGKIEGASILYRNGSVQATAVAYVPLTFDKVYRTPIAPVTLEVVSDSADDNISGTGARIVSIDGVDSNWNYQFIQVEMNGTTPVTIPSDFLRMSRIRVLESGTYYDLGNYVHKGNITVREQGGGDVWGTLAYYDGVGVGTSLIGCFSVARGYTAHVIQEQIYASSTKQFSLLQAVRENADVVTPPYKGASVTRFSRGRANAAIVTPKGLGQEIVGPADIGYFVKTDSGTLDVDFAFDILLLNNNIP